MSWIKCSEKMPDDDRVVLIWDRDVSEHVHPEDRVIKAFRTRKGEWWSLATQREPSNLLLFVKEWMPLPAAPSLEVVE